MLSNVKHQDGAMMNHLFIYRSRYSPSIIDLFSDDLYRDEAPDLHPVAPQSTKAKSFKKTTTGGTYTAARLQFPKSMSCDDLLVECLLR